MVAPDVGATRGDVPGEVSSGVRALKASVGSQMRVNEGMEGKEGDWSWERELRAHFGNCSPGMRGSWRQPAPGTPTEGKKAEECAPAFEGLGVKVMDLDDEIARRNFRVVVVKPVEVEQCWIKEPEKARRWLYTFREEGGKGEWGVEELWP